MQRKVSLAAVVLLGSLNSIFPTTAALLLLPPGAYGRFSLVYAIYALGTTVALSAVSESWARLGNPRSVPATEAYFAALLAVGLASAVAVATSAMLVEKRTDVATVASAAACAAIYHSSSRYRQLALGAYGRVLLADTIMIAASLLTLVLLLRGYGWDPVTGVFCAWAVGSVSTLPMLMPKTGHIRRGLAAWWALYRAPAGLLVRDSGIAMLNNTLMPYVLAPILGIGNFGIYRGVGNLTVVLRLLVSAVRPMIARRRVVFWSSTPVLFSAVALALAGGGVVTLALWTLPRLGLKLGTLNDLSGFAVITGAIVATSGLMSFFNAVARVYAGYEVLFRARVLTISLAIVAPLVGAATAGLAGAMFGLLLERTVSIFVWQHAMKNSNAPG